MLNFKIADNAGEIKVKLHSKEIGMVNQEECTGCGACINICPKDAIKMVYIDGFLYPEINEKDCIHCGLCDKVCDVCNSGNSNNFVKIYGIKHKDEQIRERSTSGGAFWLLANKIILDNGIVYGVAFDDSWKALHIRCETIEEIVKLQKSKYIQSDIGDSLKCIGDDLITGRKVLFSGTACQVSGLLAYLKLKRINVDNLITCDLICHGVPSPQVWKSYLDYRKLKENQDLQEIDFRDKSKGWRDFKLRLCYKNGKTRTYRQNEDYFFVLFFHNYIIRRSCSVCKYANVNRPADLTLGDFWGVEEFYPQFSDDKGISVVCVNTKKGEHFISSELSLSNADSIEIKKEELLRRQPNLSRPTPCNTRYDEFWEDYSRLSFEKLIKKYADGTWIGIIKRKYLFKFLHYTGIFAILLKFKNRQFK